MTKQDVSQDLSKTTAIVTGASSGIGKEIARGLLQRGAHVVLAVRDPKKGEAVARELGGRSTVMWLDVSNIGSIRAFASAFKKSFAQLDILIHNAGAWFSDRRVSIDGHELTLATNVLGPYLLSELLTDALVATPGARVVNVVSGLASDYDKADLQFRARKYDGFKAYAQSKQALRMLTWGLAARLKDKGVTVNAAAPGFVRTGFNRNAHGFVAGVIGLSARLFGASPEKGADTPLWVATSPDLAGVTGAYFDGRKQKDGKFHDPAAIADLEARCEFLVNTDLAAVG